MEDEFILKRVDVMNGHVLTSNGGDSCGTLDF